MDIRTRFAPSPTGYLHLGNIWVAFLNWLWTRQHKGKIILRIEDIDLSRCRETYISAMKEDLAWLGLDWDEEPGHSYFYGEPKQSRRFPFYEGIKRKWQEEGAIYPCFCSRARLHNISSAPHMGEAVNLYDGYCRTLLKKDRASMKKSPSWRMMMKEKDICFIDMFHGRQDKKLQPKSDDFVVFRADGAVAYQLATSMDDGEMKVSHVFRGADLMESTFYQIYVLQKMGYKIPSYGHLPLLVDQEGVRLSKRQKGITVRALREAGKQAEDIVGQLLYWAGAISKQEPVSVRQALENVSFDDCRNLKKSFIYT